MPLRLHIWIVRAITLIFGSGLLIDLWPLTASGPIGWLGLLFILLIWSGFWVGNLYTSPVLACPLCGRSYGPRILFWMRCPHCGGEVPQDARSPKHIWAAALLLAALLLGIWIYCRPLHFPNLTKDKEPVQITCIQVLPPVVEDGIAIPQQEMTRIVVEPDSPKMKALEETLSRYRYHRCFQTLTTKTSIENVGDLSFYIHPYEAFSFELNIHSCRHFFLNDRVYHIGWFGNGQGQRLAAELAQVLELN